MHWAELIVAALTAVGVILQSLVMLVRLVGRHGLTRSD